MRAGTLWQQRCVLIFTISHFFISLGYLFSSYLHEHWTQNRFSPQERGCENIAICYPLCTIKADTTLWLLLTVGFFNVFIGSSYKNKIMPYYTSLKSGFVILNTHFYNQETLQQLLGHAGMPVQQQENQTFSVWVCSSWSKLLTYSIKTGLPQCLIGWPSF